jgi:hypothetical protein
VYSTDLILQVLFKKTEDGQWFVEAVRLLRTTSFVPVLDCPVIEVTICKDGVHYDLCTVHWLQEYETKDPLFWTKLDNNDKVNVRIECSEEIHPLSSKLPYTLKII